MERRVTSDDPSRCLHRGIHTQQALEQIKHLYNILCIVFFLTRFITTLSLESRSTAKLLVIRLFLAEHALNP